jgi:SAM-dependent methyltransferase
VPVATYDEIGRAYAEYRRADPRINARILRALGDARSVVNVGAGTGSYEPADRPVTAVEPSAVMIAQRPPSPTAVVQAAAERLPFADRAFDAALAVLTVHHWPEPAQGLAELRRVSRRQVVLTFDPCVHNRFWLLQEYFPAAARFEVSRAVPVESVAAALDASRIETVPVPHDCVDGFGWAYWRRPERYLDPVARSCISMLAALDEGALAPGLERLALDLATGRWHDRHRDLLAREEIDGGFRLVVA